MNAPTRPLGQEAGLTHAQFARVAGIARREAGLCLSEAKSTMIASRLAKRLRATGFADVTSYLDFLEAPDGTEERCKLIGALTTNVSHFFRENHHFEKLAKDVLPDLIARARAGGRVRIWSAGCSTGQEPYSIAITVLRLLPDAARFDIRILATDIDDEVLDQARRGEYEDRHLQGVDEGLRRTFFRREGAGPGARLGVTEAVRRLITFRHLNLIGPWPFAGPFDVIFCRNVVIYFDAETQSALWPRFEKVLAPGGLLFIGHSERLDPAAAARLRTVGVTSYRKPLPGAAEKPQSREAR